jgi:hypothetical protein
VSPRAPLSGGYHYTSRAFGQDSAEALGRDLVRGIIELATNSDDAYARLGTRGKIWIGVGHTRNTDTYPLIVRDRAGGFADMHRALMSIGERTSDFESGAAVRGNRGRGAKDLAGFGEAIFESIHEGRYSKVTLTREGWEREAERDVTREDRQRLHVPRGGGTQVTVNVERSVRCPRHDRLAQAIAHDFQLRDIMADPDREILLAKLNDPETPTDRLRYEVDWDSLPDLVDTEIEVPGYERRVRVRAWRLPDRCDQGPSERTRPSGLLLCGRRAIYDNTLFRFEGVPYAGWVAGRIEAPEIDDLTRAFDDVDEGDEQHPDSNPIPIISRRRQGLATDHPYTQALTEAVEAVLEPIMEELEEAERERSRELESAETRRELDRLGKEAAKLMQQSLRELEEEEDPAHRPGALPSIAIVPNPLRIEVGETRTLSVICDRTHLEEGDEISLTVEPTGIVQLPSDPVRLGPHRDREDALSAQVRVEALEVDECLIEAAVNGRSEVAEVRVVEPEEPEITIPERMEFERERVKVGLGKKRTIELRAPTELVAEHGSLVELRSTDAGLVLRRSNTELEHDPDLGYSVAKVSIEGRALGARGKIEARLGPELAEISAQVAERDDGVPELRIEFSDERPTAFRAYFDPPDPRDDGSQTLKILVRHEAIKSVLGEDLSGADDPRWKILLAEIVTEAMVRRLMAKRYPVPQRVEAAQLYRDNAQWMSRLLPRMQRIVLRGPGLRVERPGATESAQAVAVSG